MSNSQTSTETASQNSPRLRGNLGPLELFFSIMGYNAPLVVIVGVLPVMLIAGNGIGTPMVFVIAGIILAAFANGFIRMSKALPRPGAFYSLITEGLGRAVGLGSGFLMLCSYFVVTFATVVFGGIVLGSLVADTLHGPHAPWYVWGAIFWAVTAVLGYLRISVSAKVTTILLFCELIVVAVYDFAVAGHGGASGLSAAPLSPSHLFDGSFGIGLMLAMGMFGGFEVAVLFRDEVRKPDRTIPRATYGVIVAAGLIYTFTSWLFINSLGVDHAMAIVAGDPEGSMQYSMQTFAGLFTADAAKVLVNTSSFAVLLCGHNFAARYAFNLSADGILPRALSGIHKKHGSPHIASLVVTVASAVVLIPVVLLKLEPYQFYAGVLGFGAVAGMIVFLLSSIAVMRYLSKNGSGERPFNRIVLPVIATVGLGATLVLGVVNFPVLTGGSALLSNVLLVLIGAVFVAGVVMAIRYRRTRPEVYQRIGRQ